MLRRSLPLILVLCLSPEAARAFDLLGVESRVQALGMTGVVSAQSAGALYYNPALMVMNPGGTVLLELSNGVHDLGIRLAPRPAGYDPATYGARLNARADTTSFPSQFSLTVGTTNNFNIPWFTGGILFHLPSAGVGAQETWFVDEREQYFSNAVRWELIGERQQTQVIMGGLAIHPIQWLALGFSVALTPASEMENRVYSLNPTDPSEVLINVRVRQDASLALTGGMLVMPSDWLSIGLAMRKGQFYSLKGGNEVQVRGSEGTSSYPLYQPMDISIHWIPDSFSAGLSAEYGRFGAYLDGTWMGWSKYRDSHHETVNMNDVWELGVGFELLAGENVLRLGGRLVPSPVPLQRGRTNLADNDRVVLTSGMGRPVRFLGVSFEADVHLQVHMLMERVNRKSVPASLSPCSGAGPDDLICDEEPDVAGLQTGNPGFPAFSSGGFLVNGGVTLTWMF